MTRWRFGFGGLPGFCNLGDLRRAAFEFGLDCRIESHGLLFREHYVIVEGAAEDVAEFAEAVRRAAGQMFPSSV